LEEVSPAQTVVGRAATDGRLVPGKILADFPERQVPLRQ
jgi:hypothetical protein